MCRKNIGATAVHCMASIFLLCSVLMVWLLGNPISGTQSARAEEPAKANSDMEFNRRVRKYILENPEVIAEAVERLRARQRSAQQRAAKLALKKHTKELYQDPDSPVGGNAKGEVTLVEFFDYNCPYCRRVAPTMTKLIRSDPQIRVVYKEFPILGPNSLSAAKVALAAQRQNKYLAFHEALMNRKAPIDEEYAITVAAKIGLDIDRLKKDMQSQTIADALQRNIKLAQALGINGTPGFVVGDKIIPGAVDLKTLKAAIEQAREAQRDK